MLETCDIAYKVDWYSRTRIYVSMTFADNPDALVESRFDKLSDFSWILMFSEHISFFTMAQIKERLRNPVLKQHLALCMEKEGEEAQKAEFLRLAFTV